MTYWRPQLTRRLTTYRLAVGLLRRPNSTFHAITVGPFSLLYEPRHQPERTP